MLTSEAFSGDKLTATLGAVALRPRNHMALFSVLLSEDTSKLLSSWESADGRKEVCTLLSDYETLEEAYDAHVAAVKALLLLCPEI